MATKPTFELELAVKNVGYRYVIGVDEAGRGPLAGPVVAAAVYIPGGFDTSGINDSKKLSSKNRELFYNRIVESCRYSIIQVGEDLIDSINIREATKLAMRQAINDLSFAEFALIDGNFVPEFIHVPSKPVINGDNLSISIAAASILAKVHRDRIMEALHAQYPIYNWKQNKGYGTQEHRDAIKLYGPCRFHRKTFGGVKEYV
jgi:ribonuclease HII